MFLYIFIDIILIGFVLVLAVFIGLIATLHKTFNYTSKSILGRETAAETSGEDDGVEQRTHFFKGYLNLFVYSHCSVLTRCSVVAGFENQ